MSFSDLTDDLPARLLREEHAGWEAVRDGRAVAYFGNKLTADAVVVLPKGVLNRDEALHSMSSASCDSFQLHEPRLVRLGDHAGVLVSRAVATAGEGVFEAWISTTYLWQDGGWKVAARQEVPVR